MKNNSQLNRLDQIQAEISFIQFHSNLNTKDKQTEIKKLEKKLMRFF